MLLCRFDANRLGLVEGDRVRDVTPALAILPAHTYPLPSFDPLIANLDAVQRCIRDLLPGAPSVPLKDVSLLSPVASPGKIVAAPVNYLKHLDEARGDAQIHHRNQVGEIQRVGLFLKATSSLVGPAAGVALKHPDRRNDHEAEVVVVIGRRGRDIPAARAHEYIAGYCVGLDMTTRGPEERSLRKSIDTYSVLGPWMATPDEVPDPANLDFWLTVNGQPRQRANTRDLVLGIPELIELASSFYTLHPGDLLYTGTPEGVGPVEAGDVIDVEVAGVGRMTVAVRQAQAGDPA
ncbi:fumarylacetoacetate hydrolase family protein [Pigmentiphaga kullae]|uniref:2-keto-4-pentenoate hydratase/2-oxohepta-3-ene-1,7-dioic acid hydratase in catechol pathway n=1 Tax=Pigmentiphaga kullae TaxID=151784 RepID=A0A4Q7NN45_9BURK|nr:fumarylacetoacetate hydrolase family protein [Pigmentiphaga kullae]RZS86641.1 2-keto-4-pentenoate hydratase/2-oxohepta-3-ene-1,7-dioic acid hydratase in catechol pathway [Pigmentiphaga kullae]